MEMEVSSKISLRIFSLVLMILPFVTDRIRIGLGNDL